MTRKIFFSIGDAGGIGPEVIFRAIAILAREVDSTFVLVGPEQFWSFYRQLLKEQHPDQAKILDEIQSRISCHHIETDLKEPRPGMMDREQGRVSAASLEKAVELCQASPGSSVVTAPINKESLRASGSKYPGHTEYLRDLAGVQDTTMAFVGGGLVLALGTIHVPLRQVSDMITSDLVQRKSEHLDRLLKLLKTEKRRIGVCGLNPHAGENGLFGSEDQTEIQSGIDQGNRNGLDLSGPLPGDTVFFQALQGQYDGVLAMYHDQGLAPLKTIAFDSAVNITLGLPFIRTSPDHGTAFDLAGKGIANPESMKQAILLADKLSRS